MIKADLLIIDPQNDFCDQKGSLFVPGANEDCKRLSKMIERLSKKINDVHTTLDTHHYFDIAHPIFWKDELGKHPGPFTIIIPDDVKNGKWKATNPAMQKRAYDYVKALATNGRYPLCIWPPHCLIGSWGAAVNEDVWKALNKWEIENIAFVDYVTKGSNFWTEHYSAVQADVPDPDDPGTQLNTQLIQTLQQVDIIAISGQALSHCVANTITDIANNFGEDNIKKFVLLEDTCSNVPGFEKNGEDFVKQLTARGMQISKSTDFLA
jgi:nicotinamidase-related amidase